jgi:hypothetical protein
LVRRAVPGVCGKLDLVMRQDYRAGEKLFVDWAGQMLALFDRPSGEVCEAQVFVVVLGTSNYTYADLCTYTDLCRSHPQPGAIGLDRCPYTGAGISRAAPPRPWCSTIPRPTVTFSARRRWYEDGLCCGLLA